MLWADSISKDLGGAFWFYEGETLGFRAIFAYWPQYDLLITAAVNSQAPNGEDRLGPDPRQRRVRGPEPGAPASMRP